MHVRLMFPNEYLAEEDLMGKEVTLTIDAVRPEKIKTDRGEEEKFVVTFREMADRVKSGHSRTNKRLVLNKTNAYLIAEATKSKETDEWVGKRITLYPTTCQAFGKTVTCIRVREKTAQTRKAG